MEINARNVNTAYYEAMWKLAIFGVDTDTRNGVAKSMPFPVITTYERPTERMLYDPKRRANPYFHIIESMWMLSGSNVLSQITPYNARMIEYSDDGVTQAAAYGHRWRQHWDIDQVAWVIQHLRDNPNSRRAVIMIGDPMTDIPNVDNGGKDAPCNLAVHFRMVKGALDMTVFCRSNDAVWGCYGANAVHFSMLQEFVAVTLDVPVGRYHQISDDLHVYEKHFDLLRPFEHYELYSGHAWTHVQPHDGDPNALMADLELFFGGEDNEPQTSFATNMAYGVLWPLRQSWLAQKALKEDEAYHYADMIVDGAIMIACRRWLQDKKWEVKV